MKIEINYKFKITKKNKKDYILVPSLLYEDRNYGLAQTVDNKLVLYNKNKGKILTRYCFGYKIEYAGLSLNINGQQIL